MEEVERSVLRSAVEGQRGGQSFEESLAINVRKAGLGYEAYIDLIGMVREASRRHRMEPREAAKLLSDGP